MRGATDGRWSSHPVSTDFNPRTPCGVRLCFACAERKTKEFQSTHPLRGATNHQIRLKSRFFISIHAPLAGCDRPARRNRQSCAHFNPRTPCGVRPSRSCSRPSTTATFQSTHPLRGATAGTGFEPIAQGHFNPRTPCGVRLNISMIIASAVMYFNPRTPCGVRQKIQNHKDSAKYFNPRTPCGVRQGGALFYRAALYFNPRTPCGVRRCIHFDKFQPQTISIHAPLAGCDPSLPSKDRDLSYFNPRTPCGVRLFYLIFIRSDIIFQSTHPLRGATSCHYLPCVNLVFQSTHPLRGATAKMHKIFCAFCDNRQFYRVSPSGVPSVGALFTYSRGLQRAGAGANLPVNGCALGLRAKSSASPQAGRSACSRSVRFYSRTSCRGNKTAGCRVPDP